MQTLPSQFGRYTVRSIVAQTAMSTVYEAWDERIGRRVAVKTMTIIDPDDFESRELLARFARGARAAGQLNHRNIVQVYDYAEQHDVVYLVMEFIEGRTLKSELDNSGAMDPSRVVAILDQVLQGLGYSHARGVVHRDMKPANILLTDRDEAKITDFGIARMERSDLTQPGMFIGTPAYMSPEQFRGDPIDFRTDIYSVGVILYQMLTARRPYEGSLATIMHKVLNTEPPPPSSFGGTALAIFDPVVRRAMAKRPQDRFTSASDFAQAIEAAADVTTVRVTSAASRPMPGATTVKRPVPIRPPAAQRVARRPRRAAAWQLYVVAGSLFATAAAIALVRSFSQNQVAATPPVTVASLPVRPAEAPVPTPQPTEKSAVAELPVQSVSPPVLPAVVPLAPAAPAQDPVSLRPPHEPVAAAPPPPPPAPPADTDSLRRVLLRLSHERPDAEPRTGHTAGPRLRNDHASPDTPPHDQGAIDDSTLSVLWSAASSSPIGLLLQGNASRDGPGQARGLKVIGVVAGSPAERAGCRAGDLILAVNGRPVTDPAVFDQLRSGQFGHGSTSLHILRDGQTKTLPIAAQSAARR